MTGCKELDGNFVSFSKHRGGISVQFHNPSVRDFLQGYCFEHQEEMTLLLKGASFFEQIMWLATYTRKDEDEPAFKSLLLENVKLWIDRLRKTINGPSCTTVEDFDYTSNGWAPLKATPSFESRVQQLVALRAPFDCRELDELLQVCWRRFVSAWPKKYQNKTTSLAWLSRLKTYRRIFPKSQTLPLRPKTWFTAQPQG